MATVLKFEDLEVWKEARELAKIIFELTSADDFPRDYGFIRQINDAAGSMMDNIAEGFERGSRYEFINYLSFSKGSGGEVRSQVHRGFDRKYFKKDDYDELHDRVMSVSRKLGSLMIYLNQKNIRGSKFKSRT